MCAACSADVPNWLLTVVVTGNLLDLEEVAKAPLSTVSANTNNVDETLRPQVLGNNSVVWVSSSTGLCMGLGSSEPGL